VVNERVRRCMLRAGLDAEALARAAQVSAKTVDRWLRGDVVPYPRTRHRVAGILREDESYLWPGVVDQAALAGAEMVAAYPRRADVPGQLWTELLQHADRSVDLLAFAGLFLTEEHPDWMRLLLSRAQAGVRVRLLLGDPRGANLAARDTEYKISGGVAGRVRAVLAYYRPLARVAEIRVHDTPLYNSIYRFDDEMLVNTHVYGIRAAYTPVLRLRRVDGAYFGAYLESFERVWGSARSLPDDEAGDSRAGQAAGGAA